MKVKKQMLNKELRPFYNKYRVVPKVLSKKWSVKLINDFINKTIKGRNIEGLDCDEIYIPSTHDDYQIRLRIYRPLDNKKQLPVLLYIHGGGYITGIPDSSDTIIKKFILTRPCVVIAPDYRKALTKPYPAALNDCYDTLLWAKGHCDDLNIITDKFMVAGHSAGGGLSAAVTLKARDTKDINIAFQMPLYPMLDDTQPFDLKRFIITPTWDSRSNKFAWDAYLLDLHKKHLDIPAYASPSRNHDYHDFPPTITFVGTLEPFYWETVEYVQALEKEGIDVAFKIFEGCFHGFDTVVGTHISNEAIHFTYDYFAKFYDKYVI
ncbi:MAG: alpha/beta hydrolase [Acholeplasmataceae bacterium]